MFPITVETVDDVRTLRRVSTENSLLAAVTGASVHLPRVTEVNSLIHPAIGAVYGKWYLSILIKRYFIIDQHEWLPTDRANAIFLILVLSELAFGYVLVE